MSVVFPAGARHVQFEAVWIHDESGGESLEGFQSALVVIGQQVGESHAVSLHGNVHIQVFMPQQEIADETTDRESRDPRSLGQSACLLQAIENLGWEVVAHQRAEIVS